MRAFAFFLTFHSFAISSIFLLLLNSRDIMCRGVILFPATFGLLIYVKHFKKKLENTLNWRSDVMVGKLLHPISWWCAHPFKRCAENDA